MKTLTFPSSYQGYQLTMVGRFSASMEYRVAVTGTTASVSPLQDNFSTQFSLMIFKEYLSTIYCFPGKCTSSQGSNSGDSFSADHHWSEENKFKAPNLPVLSYQKRNLPEYPYSKTCSNEFSVDG